MEFERNGLPAAPLGDVRGRLVVLDGRVGHDVPTVVTLGDGIVRWGAGATWAQALERAVFGHDVAAGVGELARVADGLAAAGVTVAGVDLASPLLARAGIFRTSVQLMLARGGTVVGRSPVECAVWRRR